MRGARGGRKRAWTQGEGGRAPAASMACAVLPGHNASAMMRMAPWVRAGNVRVARSGAPRRGSASRTVVAAGCVGRVAAGAGPPVRPTA